MGIEDIHFFGVANANLNSLIWIRKEKAETILPQFDLLMDSLLSIYGESHVISRGVFLEYGTYLLKAGHTERALEQFSHYLRLNDAGEKYSLTHRMRLKMAHSVIKETEFDGEVPDEVQQVLDRFQNMGEFEADVSIR